MNFPEQSLEFTLFLESTKRRLENLTSADEIRSVAMEILEAYRNEKTMKDAVLTTLMEMDRDRAVNRPG